MQARWRGNIRELRNVVERLLIMSERDVIEAADVQAFARVGGRPTVTLAVVSSTEPATTEAAATVIAAAQMTESLPDRPVPPPPSPATLREFKEISERAFLVEKLKEHGWNISKTAEVIDTPRSNLYKKLEQYNIRQDE